VSCQRDVPVFRELSQCLRLAIFYAKFPTTAEFLAYAKAMKPNKTPGGMSLGHATGRRQYLGVLVSMDAWREYGRRERQGDIQFTRN
jgi:hypothetical protein